MNSQIEQIRDARNILHNIVHELTDLKLKIGKATGRSTDGFPSTGKPKQLSIKDLNFVAVKDYIKYLSDAPNISGNLGACFSEVESDIDTLIACVFVLNKMSYHIEQ